MRKSDNRPFSGVILKELKQTCGGCPSQWDGVGPDGEYVYIRYRWGHLRVDVDGETEWSTDVRGGGDGVMDTNEMLNLTGLRYEKLVELEEETYD